MHFKQLVEKRRACHNFLPNQTIPRTDLEEIIRQTSYAPSGYNAQPWEFIIIEKNIEKIQKIAFDQPHLKNAAAIIIILGDTKIGRNVDHLLKDWLDYGYCTEEEIPAYKNSIAKNRKPEVLEKMALRNAMLAAMTLIYSAEDLGYDTCPIMGFSQHELETALKIPKDRIIGLMIAIGKNDHQKEPPRLPRKTPQELIHWETFSG